MDITNEIIAYFTARVILGVLLFFQSYDRIFNIGLSKVNKAVDQSIGPEQKIPGWEISVITFFTSWIEFIAGILLITGFFTPFALWAVALDLILVTIGFSMLKPMWDTGNFLPRMALLLLLLLLPESWNHWSLDSLINKM